MVNIARILWRAMIGSSRAIAIVTARAGSKGVPGKNVRPLGGKPLIAWTIEAAQRTPAVDRVVVSTDGREIGEVSRELGAEVLERPADLAGDAARSIDVLRHAIGELRAQGEDARYMVLLQPTSPFRGPEDVERALELLDRRGIDCVVSMTEASLHPYLAFRIDDGVPSPFIEGAEFWRPRQELPPAYEPNGAVYAFAIDALGPEQRGLPFGDAGAILMDPLRSLDIDDEKDLLVAEAILARGLLDRPQGSDTAG